MKLTGFGVGKVFETELLACRTHCVPTIPLGEGSDAFEDALKEQFGGEAINVVLDYLWEQSADYHQKSSGKTP
jgi:hypothetical protein